MSEEKTEIEAATDVVGKTIIKLMLIGLMLAIFAGAGFLLFQGLGALAGAGVSVWVLIQLLIGR